MPKKKVQPQCAVLECSRPAATRAMCPMHYMQWLRTGAAERRIRKNGEGGLKRTGYIVHTLPIGVKFAHVMLAERALGRLLRGTEQVHHADGNPENNNLSNLVICPDMEYHKLLHARLKAYRACGNPDWRFCTVCKKYDALSNLDKHANRSTYWHRDCINAYHISIRNMRKTRGKNAVNNA